MFTGGRSHFFRFMCQTCRLHRHKKVQHTVWRNLNIATQVQDVVIASGVRTPIGSFQGLLSPLSATDLGAVVIREAVNRAGLSPDAVDECYMGHVLQSGARQTPARQALLKAGLPDHAESTTINKACASGMKAVMIGAQSVMLDQAEVVMTGGFESLSNTPFIIHRQKLEWKNVKVEDSMFYDGYIEPSVNLLVGQICDLSNKKLNISREDQDAYCIRSYQRSAEAWRSGFAAKEIVPVKVETREKSYEVAEDEEYTKLNLDKVPHLKPAFGKDGTCTAANSSKISDGASAIVLMSASAANKHGVKPLARIVAFADAATAPINFPSAPAMAVEKLLKKTGVHRDDVTLWENNEAFSGVVLTTTRQLGIDPEKVNVRGGAVSLGHPVGSSGSRCVLHLAHMLEKGQIGVASICNGGGGASAIMLESL